MTGLLLLLFGLLGVSCGAVHLLATSREADLLVRGGAPLMAVALRLGRFALTIPLLVVAAHQGWPMLASAFAGFLIARHLLLRRLGPAA